MDMYIAKHNLSDQEIEKLKVEQTSTRDNMFCFNAFFIIIPFIFVRHPHYQI